MNRQEIYSHLAERGYDVELSADEKTLYVNLQVAGKPLRLSHQIPGRIAGLPAFDLEDAAAVGTLAHVIPYKDDGRGNVCVEDVESVSVNFNVPRLAYEESVERHCALLDRLITDADWNRSELIRELHSNWEFLCAKAETLPPVLYVANSASSIDGLQVKKPENKATYGLRGNYLALPQQQASNKAFDAFRRAAGWGHRQTVGKAIILRLTAVEPAPTNPVDVHAWYFDAIQHLHPDDADSFQRFQRHPGKSFWLVFSVDVGNGTTWFAIRFASTTKKKLPSSVSECDQWRVTPHSVRSLSRESLVPRGGASLDLHDKHVLLVGCGSVGSEIAHRICASGVGRITITDPDTFTEDNLYRHTLSIYDIGAPKSIGVADALQLKYPWVVVDPKRDRLEAFENNGALDAFDLVIVAIGSPTVERAFHDAYQALGAETPLINAWIEAHGIGGHATLDVPNKAGCLKCAYVDPETLARGLTSNLNFLAPNQNVTQAHAGCGNQFLPYSSVAATYTATMAADLAVRHLSDRLNESSKISWKGDATEARRQGLKLSYRFEHFSKSLQVLPLLNVECDVCTS